MLLYEVSVGLSMEAVRINFLGLASSQKQCETKLLENAMNVFKLT